MFALPSPESSVSDKTISIVTHQQGSWKWQPRHAISVYRARMTRDGRCVWRSIGHSDDKVTPGRVRQLRDAGMSYGGLHNQSTC